MQVDVVADRIRSNPQTFHGKPTVRDTRVAVEHVLGMLADGASTSDILENYPFLDEDDVRACIAYARQGGADGKIPWSEREPARAIELILPEADSQ